MHSSGYDAAQLVPSDDSPLGCGAQPKGSPIKQRIYLAGRKATCRFPATPGAGWNE
jgi:hypothetical protein